MNRPRDERQERRRRERGASPDDRIRDAVARIERVARDLSASASDRAADYIEGVADRLSRDDTPREEHERAPSWPWSGQPRTPRLARDGDNGKLLGVCAGIANHYGLESWVVRLIALSGLLFLPTVTLMSYFVAALLMDPASGRVPRVRSRHRGPRRRKRRERRYSKENPTGEYVWVPRQRLREVGAEFDQMELKLRRMETHVTSGHYELHRELAELEKRDAGSSISRSG